MPNCLYCNVQSSFSGFVTADDFPVLAFTGAPAPFPVQPENIPIQVKNKIKRYDSMVYI